MIIKALKEELKNEKVELILNDKTTITEEKNLVELITGSFNEDKVVEMKLSET